MACRMAYQCGLQNGTMLWYDGKQNGGEGGPMAKTLYEKVFDRHVVRKMGGGHYQVLVGLHLIHEVTSPQAFEDLRDRGLAVRRPERTFATQDHANPTESLA